MLTSDAPNYYCCYFSDSNIKSLYKTNEQIYRNQSKNMIAKVQKLVGKKETKVSGSFWMCDPKNHMLGNHLNKHVKIMKVWEKVIERLYICNMSK